MATLYKEVKSRTCSREQISDNPHLILYIRYRYLYSVIDLLNPMNYFILYSYFNLITRLVVTSEYLGC